MRASSLYVGYPVNARELLDLLIRWVHLIAGIMWIGNSMLFNWLDRNLILPPGSPEGLQGRIWMVHSGGFYEVEKKQLQPNEMPAVLHWFKWQNGITWLSGISLLIVVYYLGGGAYLVDSGVSRLGVPAAIGLSLGLIAGSWLFYDAVWRSPLARSPRVAGALSLAALAGLVYGLTQTLSGRAAYIHVGVIMGTVMTGNVWFIIMPSQRALVSATQEGRTQDLALAMRAKERSIHNNYMTFPLLFLMVSNHFPSTYGSPINYAILGVLMVAGALVRHAMNIRYHDRRWAPLFATSLLGGITLLIILTVAPSRRGPAATSVAAEPVPFKQVQGVISRRCVACHSQSPTDDTWRAAPAGVMFDTPEQIQRMAARIRDRAVVSRTMPLGNKTGITPAERDLLGDWIDQGAKLE
jgi:uncharacterized membrane protein